MAQQLSVRYIQFYTNGSAARKLAPAAPKKKAVLPRARRSRRSVVYVDPVATAGIVVAVCMLTMMLVGLLQLQTARNELAAMHSYVNQLTQENDSLSTQYREGYDLEKVRQTALALDMIPAEQAQHITISVVPELPPQETATLWEQIGTFLSGLFA